jgi:hypothetical protein
MWVIVFAAGEYHRFGPDESAAPMLMTLHLAVVKRRRKRGVGLEACGVDVVEESITLEE